MKRRTAIKTLGIGMGVSISATALIGMLDSCKSDSSAVDAWSPTYLSGTDADLISELSDIILPATETPGAKDAYVVEHIDNIIENFYDQAGKDKFANGMKVFKKMTKDYSTDAEGKESYSINREELTTLLQENLGKYTREELDEQFGLGYGDLPS